MKSLEHQRQALLAQVGLDQPLVAGSLNRIERKGPHGRVTVYYLLTFKEAQTTRSVYVPKDMVKEVQAWTRNYRRLKQKLAHVSTLSIAIIRKYGPEKRADAAASRGRSNAR
jgi:hypothetical protein